MKHLFWILALVCAMAYAPALQAGPDIDRGLELVEMEPGNPGYLAFYQAEPAATGDQTDGEVAEPAESSEDPAFTTEDLGTLLVLLGEYFEDNPTPEKGSPFTAWMPWIFNLISVLIGYLIGILSTRRKPQNA